MHYVEGAYVEGAVQFQTGNAFYRSHSATSRDFGVLAASIYRQNQGHLRILDGMSGCGVRALRYLQEAAADFVWINDADSDVDAIVASNLSTTALSNYTISHTSVQDVLRQSALDRCYFDMIDLDAFGNPLKFVGLALQALKIGGLLYLTSTDGRSLSGQLPDQSVRQWGSITRSHPAVHEQALRVLIGAIAQQALTLDYGIAPVIAYFSGSIWRVMVRLLPKPHKLPNGWLGYCHHCGEFSGLDWRSLGRLPCVCSETAGNRTTPYFPTVSGPLWLGPLHDSEILTAMQAQAIDRGWLKTAQLLGLMQSELNLPPYFYTLGEIGRRGKIDIPKADRLATALVAAGYDFSRTHIHPEGFKTTASFAVCLQMARSIEAGT
jgi:tRNA (guanine26-N2/guanine27-N2)-dimethyltransferase